MVNQRNEYHYSYTGKGSTTFFAIVCVVRGRLKSGYVVGMTQGVIPCGGLDTKNNTFNFLFLMSKHVKFCMKDFVPVLEQ